MLNGTRPEGVTQAWIDETIKAFRADPDCDIPSYMRDDCNFLEGVLCTGKWLSDQLEPLGFSADEIQNATFALGQRLFFSRDRWGLAQKYLAAMKEGHRDESGTALAEALEARCVKIVPGGN